MDRSGKGSQGCSDATARGRVSEVRWNRKESVSMSDYIKREDAIRQIVKTSAQNELDIPAIGTVIYILSEMDSADVVEVVRCKDCKFYEIYPNGANGDCINRIDAFNTFYPNDFCSYGERKDEGL